MVMGNPDLNLSLALVFRWVSASNRDGVYPTIPFTRPLGTKLQSDNPLGLINAWHGPVRTLIPIS